MTAFEKRKAWVTAGDEPTVRPNKILMVNLGRIHDDRDNIAHALEEKGFEVIFVNLLEHNFNHFDFSKVAAVDMKGCRGWQQNIDYFHKQLELLDEKIIQSGRIIPVSNPAEMFHWASSKEYMAEFDQQGVRIIPTTFVRREDELKDIAELIEQSPLKRIVLKPAVGTRATAVIFIRKTADGEFEITSPKPLAESPTPHVLTVTREILQAFVKGYKEKIFAQESQPAFLIQNFIEGQEISAVFVGSTPHFVMRTRTETNLVAHEDFGGENILVEDPHPMLVELAHQVHSALPEKLAKPPYMRVDMLFDQADEPPYLLEVEAGSARLFLNEANRVEDYAEMISGRVREAATEERRASSNLEVHR